MFIFVHFVVNIGYEQISTNTPVLRCGHHQDSMGVHQRYREALPWVWPRRAPSSRLARRNVGVRKRQRKPARHPNSRYTVRMYSVKQLRRHGARLSDRQIQSDPAIAGQLTMAMVGNTYELKLHAENDGSTREPLIPVLFDARLISMHGDKMLFRGLERRGGVDEATYLQEWSVKIM